VDVLKRVVNGYAFLWGNVRLTVLHQSSNRAERRTVPAKQTATMMVLTTTFLMNCLLTGFYTLLLSRRGGGGREQAKRTYTNNTKLLIREGRRAMETKVKTMVLIGEEGPNT
jgi:hypothetical protein